MTNSNVTSRSCATVFMDDQKLRHRAIANARERDRTESVNYAFTLLRQLLPTEPKNRKLSKIEILRLATSYIDHLNNVLNAIFQGEADDDICSRLAEAEGQKSNKVCTFCITASKAKSANSMNQNAVLNYESYNVPVVLEDHQYHPVEDQMAFVDANRFDNPVMNSGEEYYWLSGDCIESNTELWNWSLFE